MPMARLAFTPAYICRTVILGWIFVATITFCFSSSEKWSNSKFPTELNFSRATPIQNSAPNYIHLLT